MNSDILNRVKTVQQRSNSFSNDWWGIIEEDATTGVGEPYTDDDQMRLDSIFRDYNGIIKELLDENKKLSEKLE